MSATAATFEPPAAAGAATRPGLGRLTAVELRKMVDTRAGLWLQISAVAITVAVVAIFVFAAHDDDQTLINFLALAAVPSTVLLPVVGILLVTSEWTQRTTLITFSLVPQRSRVIVAKLAAGVLLSLAALVLALVMAVVGTAAAGSGVEGAWSLPLGIVGQAAVSIVVPMITGLAFGAVLLASAPAIVLYFVLPTAWSALGSLSALEGAAEWLDQSRTMTPLIEETLSSTEWARVATSVLLWTVLPAVIGIWRIKRSEIR